MHSLWLISAEVLSYAFITTASHIFSFSGLVDAHTHPVWAGDRVHEFAMKVCQTNEC